MRGRRFDLLPTFEPWARLRPVALTRPEVPLGLAPYASVERALAGGRGEVSLTSGSTVLTASWDGGRLALTTTHGAAASNHAADPPEALALTLTGPRVTAWTRHGDRWTAGCVVDLTIAPSAPSAPSAPDVHDAGWLAGLEASGDVAGGFGQLGLRDLRLVTHADGTPYRDGPDVLLPPPALAPVTSAPATRRCGRSTRRRRR